MVPGERGPAWGMVQGEGKLPAVSLQIGSWESAQLLGQRACRGEWGCRRSSGREVSSGTAPGTPRTWRAPWRCRQPRGHTGTCDWRGREGASPQRRLGLPQEGDGASERWPCQWSRDIPTGTVTKHRPQLAVSGDGERGSVPCPVVLCPRARLSGRSCRGKGRKGKAAAPNTGRSGAECAGVGSPVGQPAAPAAPAARHGRRTAARATPSAAAAGAPLCPSAHPHPRQPGHRRVAYAFPRGLPAPSRGAAACRARSRPAAPDASAAGNGRPGPSASRRAKGTPRAGWDSLSSGAAGMQPGAPTPRTLL